MKTDRSKNGTHNEYKRFFVFGLIAIGFLLGCSSMEKSVSLGVASGAAAGTGFGLAIGGEDRTKSTLISAGVGALLGGITSYVIHGSLDKRDDTVRRDTLFNLESHGITRAKATRAKLSDVGEMITSPDVDEDWVDTHTDGQRLIEGHRIWTITNGSMWDLNRKPERKKRK